MEENNNNDICDHPESCDIHGHDNYVETDQRLQGKTVIECTCGFTASGYNEHIIAEVFESHECSTSSWFWIAICLLITFPFLFMVMLCFGRDLL